MISNSDIEAAVERITPGLVALRRRLHQHPELAFEEQETARAIVEYLSKIGAEARTGVGKTGVVTELEGAQPGRRIGLRADIDALPVTEASGVAFPSQVPGRMHACGHDVHTVIALGVAHVLSDLRAQMPGSVKLIFQPAEETLAGAAAMIADGVLDGPPLDAIVGYHNWPVLETGLIGYHAGAVMASSDGFDIVLTGRAGHAAHPHTAIDALVGAAHVISQLQTVVSREIAPSIPTVLTIGQIEGGTARNVIAARVVLRGTARTLDAAAAKQVEASVRRVVEGAAQSFRLGHEITWTRQAPVLKNDAAVLARVLASARSMLGEDKIVDLGAASMGSEDFAWFAERIPAAHVKIGSKIAGLETAIHRANYDCNELAIPIGIRAVTRAVVDLLAEK
jgi:hippurate hydrolase